MSNAIYKSQTNVYSNQRNLLNTRLSERCKHLQCDQGYCEKMFDLLSEFEQKQLLKHFKLEYSLILFDYFSNENSISDKINDFAIKAFNVGLPISKVVEIHLDIIDTLEHQLIVEGLHAECIGDFRLTLIDVIAHLGEMYRSAIYKKCFSDSHYG